MFRVLALAILVLPLSPLIAAGPEVTVKLEAKTLKLKDRLRFPYMKIEVGAGRDLTVVGNSKPVRFREEENALLLGRRKKIGDGDTFEVWLDNDDVLTYGLSKGRPHAGQPAWWVVSCDSLTGRIGREKVVFLDHDGDGTFFTPYRDLIVHKKEGAVHPVADYVVLGREVYKLSCDEAKREIRWVEWKKRFAPPDMFPNWSGVARGLAHLNRIRAGMNLPPVALDRDASHRAMLHLQYCSLNGGNPHIEEEGKRGYTKEGAEAGINSIGYRGSAGVVTAIDGHISSILHRMDLIDPRMTKIGVATGSGRVWIHTECGKKRPWEGQGVSIFPGPNRSWKSGAYAVDNPDPRPKDGRNASGLPITVAWFGQSDGVTKVRVELRSPRGKVDCLKNDADSRDLTTNAPTARAVLMPKSPLDGPYRLFITWLEAGEKRRLEYEFRIGK